MPNWITRRSALLLTGLLVFAAAGLVLRTESVSAKRKGIAPEPQQSAASAGQASGYVIRFVKDPEMAPAFEAKALTGEPVSRARLKGKVILMNFWATWCPPCRAEIPELIALQNEFKDQLEVVGVSEDEDPPAQVLRFAKQMGINYPIAMSTNELTKDFGGVEALPTTFIIDTQGRVVQKHRGVYPMEEYELEIESLLGKKVNARIETFEDKGEVNLKNAANATELPGVDLESLTPEQKKAVLHRMNAETCTCGCMLTVAQCRINDSTCSVSLKTAYDMVMEAASGGKSAAKPPAKAIAAGPK
jgi:thiol-disulfide isomerase/thioredoxin